MGRRAAYHAGSTARQIRNASEGPDSGPAEAHARTADPLLRDRIAVALLVAAALSRLIWVLWVHPPQDHVFSDMAHYVHRARLVASGEVGAGDRMMAWQAWGTHALLAIPMLLLGPTGDAALELSALLWAGFSTATVVLSYRLATRVLPRPDPATHHWPALAIGVATLLWFPLVSHTGFFISETPFTCVLLATSLALVEQIQTGRGAARAGIYAGLSFALRPQVVVFFALLGLAWLLDRRRRAWSGRVDGRAALAVAIPLALMLAVSLVRARVYVGEFAGVAENATMNLTAGRCHNVVTRAFDDPAELAAAASGQPGARANRRISLPGFRALAAAGPEHPLALRPALGGESIDFVGYIGDRAIHREIRRRCYAATGWSGQLRYSVTNLALAWVVARPWPESSDREAAELLPIALRGRDLAAVFAPFALLGMVLGLWRWARVGRVGSSAAEVAAEVAAGSAAGRERVAGLGLCALQLLAFVITSALFFASPRLRTPYDPYALILTAAVVLAAGAPLSRRLRGARLPSANSSP